MPYTSCTCVFLTYTLLNKVKCKNIKYLYVNKKLFNEDSI